MAEIRHLENGHDVIFFLPRVVRLDKISQTGTKWHVDCGDVWKWKPYVEFQYGGRFGEFNGMSFQSHVSHCRVLPLSEFTVMILEPHATLQGAVTWWNQCRNRATLQGVKIPSGILKIVFRHILFYFVFNAAQAWTSGGFRIVSDTLVTCMFRPTHIFIIARKVVNDVNVIPVHFGLVEM